MVNFSTIVAALWILYYSITLRITRWSDIFTKVFGLRVLNYSFKLFNSLGFLKTLLSVYNRHFLLGFLEKFPKNTEQKGPKTRTLWNSLIESHRFGQYIFSMKKVKFLEYK